MSVFHIQKIRSCVSCGKVLPLKCSGCAEHPGKPVVIELYDFPEPIRVGPCGCLLLRCERPGCGNEFWRYTKLHYSKAKSKAKTFFCSQLCAAKNNGHGTKQAVKVPCEYCGTKVDRQPAELKLSRHVYCKPECCYLWRRKNKWQERQDYVKQKHRLEAQVMLECLKCKDILEHDRVCTDFVCTVCGTKRDGKIKSPCQL